MRSSFAPSGFLINQLRRQEGRNANGALYKGAGVIAFRAGALGVVNLWPYLGQQLMQFGQAQLAF